MSQMNAWSPKCSPGRSVSDAAEEESMAQRNDAAPPGEPQEVTPNNPAGQVSEREDWTDTLNTISGHLQ